MFANNHNWVGTWIQRAGFREQQGTVSLRRRLLLGRFILAGTGLSCGGMLLDPFATRNDREREREKTKSPTPEEQS